MPDRDTASDSVTPTLSVVIPCLNEAETIAHCIGRAREGLRAMPEPGEIVVADNGSTDGSQAIAESSGARVIPVPRRGYGAALMGGIEAAKGRWIVMGDADASYDFHDLPRFADGLRSGADLVMGCRLPSGGGSVGMGAMPWLHRWIGNPFFSSLARAWFKAPIHDVHCGMRGFTRSLYDQLNLQCTGMEFASEMVIKASLGQAHIAEVPITLHPDQRTAHSPHLRTFRDGWRHLRFYLLFSPRWLFGIPGLLLLFLGLIASVLGYSAVEVGRIGFDVHTLLFGGFFTILGVQMALFGVLAKSFAVSAGLLPGSPWLTRAARWLQLESGIMAGLASMTVAGVFLAGAVWQWVQAGFGPLDYSRTMRVAIPGVVLGAIGIQLILASFLLGVFSLPQRAQTSRSGTLSAAA